MSVNDVTIRIIVGPYENYTAIPAGGGKHKFENYGQLEAWLRGRLNVSAPTEKPQPESPEPTRSAAEVLDDQINDENDLTGHTSYMP